MIICNTASFRTVLPRTAVPYTSVFHESEDVCPSAQQTKNLGCLSTLILLRTRTRSKNPTTLLGALSVMCASSGVNCYCSTATHIHMVYRKCWIHSACPPPCFANDLSMLVDPALHVRSFDSVQLLSWQSQSSCTVHDFTEALFLITGVHNVFAALSRTAQDLRFFAPSRCTALANFLHAVQHRPGS